jgi:hypothetical protein
MIPVSWMSEFLDLATSYDPDFQMRIKGATNEQILELEKLVERPLPESYRTFLRKLGADDGGLSLAYLGSTAIDQILGSYRKMKAENELCIVPEGCIMIGTGDASAGDVCLYTDGFREPAVILSLDGEVLQRYSDSLPQLLFRTVFIRK